MTTVIDHSDPSKWLVYQAQSLTLLSPLDPSARGQAGEILNGLQFRIIQLLQKMDPFHREEKELSKIKTAFFIPDPRKREAIRRLLAELSGIKPSLTEFQSAFNWYCKLLSDVLDNVLIRVGDVAQFVLHASLLSHYLKPDSYHCEDHTATFYGSRTGHSLAGYEEKMESEGSSLPSNPTLFAFFLFILFSAIENTPPHLALKDYAGLPLPAKTIESFEAMHVKISSGSFDVKFILEFASLMSFCNAVPQVFSDFFDAVLFELAAIGDKESLDLLLALGKALLNEKRKAVMLQGAIAGHHIERIQSLIARGCNPFQEGKVHYFSYVAETLKRKIEGSELLSDPKAQELFQASSSPLFLALADSFHSKNTSALHAIMDSVKEEQRKAILDYLGSGLISYRGTSAIAIIAQGKDLDLVSELLKLLPLDCKERVLQPMLMDAIQSQDSALIAMLLDKIGSVNFQVHSGVTPLTLAASLGNSAIMDKLVASGARVDFKNMLYETPLFCAAKSGQADAIIHLQSLGADIHQPNADRVTPLMIAAKLGHVDCVQALIVLKASRRPTLTSSPLLLAVKSNEIKVVQILLQAGFDPNEWISGASETPLTLAAKNNQLAILKILLTYGASINAKNALNETPLYCAAEAGHTDIVFVLLQAGANPNLGIHAKGLTPLLVAAKGGHYTIVSYLLHKKAAINYIAGVFYTALFFAVQNSHTGIADFLLRNGAFINPKEANLYLTPPLLQGNIALFLLITRHLGKTIDSTEALALVANAIGEKTDLNVYDKEGNTLLMHLAKEGYYDALRLLLTQDVFYNEMNSVGKTALHFAAENGHLKCVQALLDAGADPELSSYKYSPLVLALRNKHRKIAKLFHQRGIFTIYAP